MPTDAQAQKPYPRAETISTRKAGSAPGSRFQPRFSRARQTLIRLGRTFFGEQRTFIGHGKGFLSHRPMFFGDQRNSFNHGRTFIPADQTPLASKEHSLVTKECSSVIKESLSVIKEGFSMNKECPFVTNQGLSNAAFRFQISNFRNFHTFFPFFKWRSVMAMFVMMILSYSALAQSTYTWLPSAAGTAWIRSSNWGGGPANTYPGVDANSATTGDGNAGDSAVFGSLAFSGNIVGVNFGTTSGGVTANGGANGSLTLGDIELSSTLSKNLFIGKSDSSSAGATLTLNGATVNSVANVILRNNSGTNFALVAYAGGSSTPMSLVLGNSTDNKIYIDGVGNITNSLTISGSGKNLTLAGSGSGILVLNSNNTYSGNTTINSGILKLSTSGSIANSSTIIIMSGATFDVSTLTTAFTLASGQKLVANGATASATNTTVATKGLTIGSGALIFTNFNGTIPPLSVAGTGSITNAAGDSVTVYTTSAFTAGDYTLITNGVGNTTAAFGTAPSSVSVLGSGVSGTASLVISGGRLVLHVVGGGGGGSPPTISSQPSNQTNNYNTTATFTVSASGTAPLGYQWYANSVAPGNALVNDGSHIGGATNSSLGITNVTLADVGNYLVVITNSSGSITSSVAALVVNDPFIVTQPANATNLLGAAASFTVSASGSGTLNYQWRTNGIAIVDGDRFSGAATPTLTDSAIVASDTNWNYTVVVGGAGLSATSSPVVLVITNVPVVALYRSKQSGNWNDIATWQSSTDGGSTWPDAVATPTSADNAIEIRNTHIVTNTASVTVDQVTIDTGGQITLNTGFTVNNGDGDDIIVQSGGVMVVSSAPTFSPSATANINGGGILRISVSGYTGVGAGMNAASYIYQNGAIVEYTLASAPSSANVVYFPNVNASTIPVLKFTALTGSPGASTPTTINGVTEIGTGVSFSWSGAGIKTFRNGIRGSGSMGQSTAGPFVISGATAELNGGTLTLNSTSGLLITNGSIVTVGLPETITAGVITNNGTLNVNSFLSGTFSNLGTGSTIVSSTGTLSPSSPGSTNSIGSLTFATAPTFNGTNYMEITNAASPNADKIVLTSGTLTYGGTLVVANIGGALVSGDTFTLFTNTANPTGFSGSFSTITLPALTSGLTWDTNGLATNGVLSVYAFTTNAFQTMAAVKNTAATLSIAKVLAKTSGGRGALTLVLVSTPANGSIVTNATSIIYTPSPDYVGPDSFNCVVQDANGAATTVEALVTVNAINASSTISTVDTSTPGQVTVTASGIPGTTYTVQYSDDSGSTWNTLGTAQAADNGVVSYVDTNPNPTMRWYRLAQ